MILRVVFAAGFMYVAYLVHSLQQEFRKLSIQYGTVMNSTTYPGIHITGDEVNVSPSTVRAYKKTIEEEFQSLLDSGDNLWKLEAVKSFSNFSLTVESRRVEGTLEKFNQPGESTFIDWWWFNKVACFVLVQRAKWRFENCDPLKLFQFLVSVEGFTVIDPFTPIEEHLRQPVVDFASEDDKRRGIVLEVRHGNLPFPISNIDFVVFNTIVPEKLLFVSKSVRNDSIPLPSPPSPSWLAGWFAPRRAELHFGIRVSRDPDQSRGDQNSGGCLVESFDYAANLNIPSVINYAYNALQFYPDFLDRLIKKYNVSDTS